MVEEAENRSLAVTKCSADDFFINSEGEYQFDHTKLKDAHAACWEKFEAGLAEGGDPDDVTELGLRNLAGNVSEWVADDFASFSDADCWPSGQLLSDPRCDEGSGLGVARGGSWILGRTSARSATRLVVGEHEQLDGVGVRCAVSR